MRGLVQRHANDFVTDANRFVPRAVFGGEDVSVVLLRKLLAVIESDFQRSVVRLKENIRHNDAIIQFRVLARVPRILIAADVIPGPAVEPVLLNVRDVVGDQVIAKRIALIYRTPEFARYGIDRKAHGIADSGGVDLYEFPSGVY